LTKWRFYDILDSNNDNIRIKEIENKGDKGRGAGGSWDQGILEIFR